MEKYKVANRPLVVANRPLVVANRPLVVANRPRSFPRTPILTRVFTILRIELLFYCSRLLNKINKGCFFLLTFLISCGIIIVGDKEW